MRSPGSSQSRRGLVKSSTLGVSLLAISILFLAPLIYIVLNSFKPASEVFVSPPTIMPQRWTLENYEEVASGHFGAYFTNSVVITVGGVLIVILLSMLAGYGFSKVKFPGSGLLLTAIIATLTVPLAILLVPMFLMENATGLLNTQLGLILPNVAVTLPFAVLIMKANFDDIPDEIEESAEIDGASRLRRWWSLMVPLTKNGLVLVTVITTYSVWGEYTLAKTLALDPPAMPLPVGLTLLKSEVWEYGVLAAVITLAVLPPIIIFVIFQRHIVQGLAQGAVKG